MLNAIIENLTDAPISLLLSIALLVLVTILVLIISIFLYLAIKQKQQETSIATLREENIKVISKSIDMTQTNLQASEQQLTNKIEQSIEQITTERAAHTEKITEAIIRLNEKYAQLGTFVHDTVASLNQRERIEIDAACSKITHTNSEHLAIERKQLADKITQIEENLQKQVTAFHSENKNTLSQIENTISEQMQNRLSEHRHQFEDIKQKVAQFVDQHDELKHLSADVSSLSHLFLTPAKQNSWSNQQIRGLISRIIGEDGNNCQFDVQLDQGKTIDCLLTLPEPIGKIGIDLSFKLDSFFASHDETQTSEQRNLAKTNLISALKQHIATITESCKNHLSTTGGIIVLLPSETLLNDIQQIDPELLYQTSQDKIWLCTPATLAATLAMVQSSIIDATARHDLANLQGQCATLNQQLLTINEHINQFIENHAKQQTALEHLQDAQQQAINLSSSLHLTKVNQANNIANQST